MDFSPHHLRYVTDSYKRSEKANKTTLKILFNHKLSINSNKLLLMQFNTLFLAANSFQLRKQ